MKILGYRDGPVSRFSHKNSDLEHFGISGEMGLISPKNCPPSLADECLPHRERGSPSLTLGESRRGHDPPLVMMINTRADLVCVHACLA